MDRMQYRFTHLERMGDLEKNSAFRAPGDQPQCNKKKDPTGMILSEDESTAILLNGDDHVRIQTLQTGLTLEQLYERADKIDDYISERFDYAFDEKYGYLTSFPTNVGTGLRAAVVLHLPMLSKNKISTVSLRIWAGSGPRSGACTVRARRTSAPCTRSQTRKP